MSGPYSKALCHYLRKPPLQGLRVWADPEYQEEVRKLGNHMRAAAKIIERYERHIEYLEMMASIQYRVPVYPDAVSSCSVEPLGGAGTRSLTDLEEMLLTALGRIAGQNDLSGVPDNEIELEARSRLYACELIADEALAQADRNPEGHDPVEGHGRNDESPVLEEDAPKTQGNHHHVT